MLPDLPSPENAIEATLASAALYGRGQAGHSFGRVTKANNPAFIFKARIRQITASQLRNAVEVLLQWILRHEQINLRTLPRVLDTLALVGEGSWKVERRPSSVHALLDFAHGATAALVIGNEAR